MKKWILYHGTGADLAKKIEKEGLKGSIFNPIYLASDKQTALEFATSKCALFGAVYKTVEGLKRKPAIFKVTLTENDFKQQTDTSPSIIKQRILNIEKVCDVANRDYWEYKYYYDIPPNKLKRVL